MTLTLGREFVHFSCTSEDINNLCYALMLELVRVKVILSMWKNHYSYKKLAPKYRYIPMLSIIHGQRHLLSPTGGKELVNLGRTTPNYYAKLWNKNAYKILKNLTRGRHVDMKVMHAFIEKLSLPGGSEIPT
ncbi:MAG: hypothetical protein V9821_00790 [Candidatus Dasytiphilus stammeri]